MAEPTADPWIGRTIVATRRATTNPFDFDPHYDHPAALVLDDGTEVIASRDEEGNGPGALFIYPPGGGSSFWMVV